MGTLLLIAMRNLMQHRRRTLLLGGALALVTTLLVVLLGLSTGLRETMLRSATTLMTGHINVAGFFKPTAGQSAPVVTGYKQVIEVVKAQVPELDFVVERGRGWGKAISDTASMQVGMAGITIDEETGFRKVIALKEGSLDGLREPNTAMLFEDQAKKLEVKVGDTITLSTTTSRGIANTADVRIVAVAENVGLLSMFNIFMPAQSLRQLYQINDDTTGAIYLYLKDMSKISVVRERLRTEFEQANYRVMDTNPVAFFMKFEGVNREDWTGQKLDLTTWEEEISFITWTLQTLDGLTAALTGILLIIIVIGIMNTMWIAIRERTREIGSLRAIGMQRTGVMTMFLFEALLLGLLGTGIGAVSGMLISWGLNLMALEVPTAVQLFLMSDTLTLVITAKSVLVSVAVISGVCTLAAVYPAWRAATLKPVTAMHHIG